MPISYRNHWPLKLFPWGPLCLQGKRQGRVEWDRKITYRNPREFCLKLPDLCIARFCTGLIPARHYLGIQFLYNYMGLTEPNFLGININTYIYIYILFFCSRGVLFLLALPLMETWFWAPRPSLPLEGFFSWVVRMPIGKTQQAIVASQSTYVAETQDPRQSQSQLCMFREVTECRPEASWNSGDGAPRS